MPTITNALNLPPALVAAISCDDYDNGGADMSVTGLLKPPRMVELQRRHAGEITEDASERMWALLGRVAHKILADGSGEKLTHHRLFTECQGWKISGEVDVVVGSVIEDYKITSVWTVKDGPKPEWTQQLNLYRYLCEVNGISISALRVTAILRDWNKMEAARNPNLPQAGVCVFDLPVWGREQTYDFLRERITAHQEARRFLPECTPEETWARPDAWAVMKEGRKSAVRVLDGEETARLWALENGYSQRDRNLLRKDISIVHRPGRRIRCEEYCSAAPFCDQFKAYQQGQKKVDEAEA